MPAAAAEFETALLSLRSDLTTYASWLSSGDTKVLSTMKQLRSNTSSLSRWDGRAQSVKKQMAQARLSAMAHMEHRLDSRDKEASSNLFTSGSSDTLIGVDSKAELALADSLMNGSLQAYEHDFETRKENLTNRFDLLSHAVFAKPVYPELVSSDDGGFLTDPTAPSETPQSRALLIKNGILSDVNAKLRLTLASDCSIIDVQVDAYGRFLEVSYDYDAPVRYVARWILQALKEGNIGVAEEIIRSSYVDRCLRHLNLSSSLRCQYAEATKSAATTELKFDPWAIPGLSIPSDHTSFHDRLRCAERDIITISRLETQKLGVSTLWKGTGWMTMNARGPVLTFFSLPLRLGAAAALINSSSKSSNSSNGTSSTNDSSALTDLLNSASEEHCLWLEKLPSIDPSSFFEFSDLPAYTSNVLAPVILSHLRPGSTLWSGHLGTSSRHIVPSSSQNPSHFLLKDVDALAFHIEVEQGRVTDPNTLRPLRCAPRSTTSSIAFFNAPSAIPSSVHIGTTQALSETEIGAYFQSLNPSLEPTTEDPTQFMDLGIQWSPFAQHDTVEDQHLPLCLKLRLEQDIPFYSSLFYRLRAIAASSDPTMLLKNYYATDEANRTGNLPPANAEAAKPKKITFRTSKSTTVVAAATPSPTTASVPFSGSTLASLFTKKETPMEPQTEDVVIQLPLSATSEAFNRAVRCLHTHHTTSTPSALMIRSVSFVDARQLRGLVAILRQQAVINALFASCFLDDSVTPFASYTPSIHKRSSHVHHDLRSSAGGPSNSRAHLHSSTNLNASFDISSPPRNRNKRSRTEMEAAGLASPEAPRRPTEETKPHEQLTDGSAEQTCHMSIELSALMEPLFGWSVMVVSNPNGPKNSIESHSSTLFSFSMHVAVDGYIHVVPSDLSAVANDQRTPKRLEQLLRATINIPLAIKLWMNPM